MKAVKSLVQQSVLVGRLVRYQSTANQHNLLVLTRKIPSSFVGCLREDASVQISLEAAWREHEEYVKALRANTSVKKIITLDADESCPDCTFVEDNAVCYDGKVLITRPGAPSRRPEVAPVAAALKPFASSIEAMEHPALLDGGDVLIVDKHIFVGKSHRTNTAGFNTLKAFFNVKDETEAKSPTCALVPVAGALHLKSLVTWAGAEIGLVAADTAGSRAAVGMIAVHFARAGAAMPPTHYVPDQGAANVLRVGNVVYYPTHCAKSTPVFTQLARAVAAQHPHITFVGLHSPELSKADAALTCCSVIVPIKQA